MASNRLVVALERLSMTDSCLDRRSTFRNDLDGSVCRAFGRILKLLIVFLGR